MLSMAVGRPSTELVEVIPRQRRVHWENTLAVLAFELVHPVVEHPADVAR